MPKYKVIVECRNEGGTRHPLLERHRGSEWS